MTPSPLAATLTLAVALAATAAPARADSLALPGNNTWSTFAVDSFLAPAATPLAWLDDSGARRVFTFHVDAGRTALLTVIDGGFAGDTFRVSSNGIVLGNTSSVPPGSFESSLDIGVDFTAALANASFSRGVFAFAAGDYTIGGSLLQSVTFAGSPLNATSGAIRLAQIAAPVPEPETIGLMLAGFALTVAWMRRRGIGR